MSTITCFHTEIRNIFVLFGEISALSGARPVDRTFFNQTNNNVFHISPPKQKLQVVLRGTSGRHF